MPIDTDIRVLVVGQMVTVAQSIMGACRRMGLAQVEGSSSGADALKRIKAGQFGLVISDWDMDPISGLDLLKAVRSDGRTRRLPFMLITSEVEVDKVILARQEGVSGYLVQPFSEAVFRQKLTGILGQRSGSGNRPRL